MERIEKSSMYIWMLEATLRRGVEAAIVVTLFMLMEMYTKAAPSYLEKGIIVYLIVAWILMMVSAFLRYKNAWFHLNEQELHSKKSGWKMEEIVIPTRRIQHVSINQTFLSRLFGVFSVRIYTAGNNLAIGYLSEERAKEVKKELTDYLKKDEEAE